MILCTLLCNVAMVEEVYVHMARCVKYVVCVCVPFNSVFLPVSSLCSLASVRVFLHLFVLRLNHIKVISLVIPTGRV